MMPICVYLSDLCVVIDYNNYHSVEVVKNQHEEKNEEARTKEENDSNGVDCTQSRAGHRRGDRQYARDRRELSEINAGNALLVDDALSE